MTALFARKALLPDGWHDNVRLEFDGGRIAAVTAAGRPADGDVRGGIAIPGLCNAHSHAFQRALAGRTEQKSPHGRDNFWTWRDRMYRLSAAITPDHLRAIAAQAYAEMLASGYTAVCEFHYLHGDSDAPAETMFDALAAAADDSGIRLTYVPVLYERGGFDDEPLSREQQRFFRSLPDFIAHFERCRAGAADALSVGIGAHSLRAVSESSLAAIADVARRDGVPLHLHIAEQQREVDQSLAVRHRRPVRWLLEHANVDSNWCLVHATHMDYEEVEALAATGAVVALCPSTEANLGDGLFPLSHWLEQGGRFAIGSDSHISINPFEELRWLEYGQRLVAEQRNIAAIGCAHTGRNLFARAAAGGAQASGQQTGALAVGNAADLVVLDDDDPMLAGHDASTLLDALVFSGFSLPLDRVLVNGRWQVVDGRHVRRDEARAAYRDTIGSIAARLAEDAS